MRCYPSVIATHDGRHRRRDRVIFKFRKKEKNLEIYSKSFTLVMANCILYRYDDEPVIVPKFTEVMRWTIEDL